ncbi:MAG: GerW family sporulation protein [Ruminococcus sp.]|nr:GerW family sporulation protein [Ruminococcus sp.]
MLWLYILIGIVLLLLLILLLPVGVRVCYDEDFTAELKIGFVSVRLYPPKPKKPKKKKKSKKPAPEKKEKEEEKEKKPSLLKEKGIDWLLNLIRQIAAIAAGALKDFFRHLVIRDLQISVTYAGEDAQDTAVKYGCFCLSIYPAVSILADIAHCRRYGVDIAPNFNEGEKSVYYADIDVRIRVLWIFGLIFRYGFRVIKLLLALRRGKTEELEQFLNEHTEQTSNKGESDMEHPIGSLMNITMEKIKEMIDVNTVVGTPITSPDGTLVIPVSKVSYGFASGGSDLPTKKENKDCFGGGSGAGVTIQPVAFLTIYQGNVRLISVNGENSAIDSIVNMIPEVVGKVKEFADSRKKKKSGETEIAPTDDFSEITVDDIDI